MIIEHFTKNGPTWHLVPTSLHPNISSKYIQHRYNTWTPCGYLASACCYWHFLRDSSLRLYIWPKRFPDSVSQLACSRLFVLNYSTTGKKCNYLWCWLYFIVFLIISVQKPGSKYILPRKVPCSIWSYLPCSQLFAQLCVL